MPNTLYYGDNLEVLRKYIKDEQVDLCYIDPPFNSKRTYNQIYAKVGTEDRAQAQAFVDTWIWDSIAVNSLEEILQNASGRFQPQTVELIKGFHKAMRESSLLAYLVSMTLRIVEIHRVLKSTGTFYLHCDPTSSHYLKIVLDSIFGVKNFRNEIVWAYRGGGRPKKDFGKKHDVILRYTKSDEYLFNTDAIRIPYEAEGKGRKDDAMWGKHKGSGKIYKPHPLGKVPEDWWPLDALNANSPERLGYPTQKPEVLLHRIIAASSDNESVILDAYCGCGTTIAVAERLNRRWLGIDITYQSVSLVLRRLEGQFGRSVLDNITLNGIPRDMESAYALALKKDDRLRKEFEKWAILTYSSNRAVINDKKGADAGIDGTAYFQSTRSESASMIFQVKSGSVGRGDIAKLRGDMERVSATMATFITLQPPTKAMIETAKAAGLHRNQLMGKSYDRIKIVTVKEIIDGKMRLELPMNLDVLKAVETSARDNQVLLFPGHELENQNQPQN